MDEIISLIKMGTNLSGVDEQKFSMAYEFAKILLKEPLKECSGIIFDKIRSLRIRNQVNILIKTKKYFEKKCVDPKQVPAKVLVPLLQGCSLEEDESLQDIWLNLLINSASPTNKKSFVIGYIDILKQLSSIEVKMLNYIFENGKNSFSLEFIDRFFDKGDSVNKLIYIDNFKRLNIIESIVPEEIYNELKNQDNTHNYPYTEGGIVHVRNFSISDNILKLTELGYDFIYNCKNKGF